MLLNFLVTLGAIDYSSLLFRWHLWHSTLFFTLSLSLCLYCLCLLFQDLIFLSLPCLHSGAKFFVFNFGCTTKSSGEVFHNYWCLGLTPDCLKMNLWGGSPDISIKKKKLFKGGRSLDALLVRMQNGSTSVEVNLTKFNKTAYAFTLQPGIITSRILPWSHTPNNTKYLCTSYVHCRIINLNAYKCSLMLFLLEIL